MPNGSTQLDREGCEYGRLMRQEVDYLVERKKILETEIKDSLSEIKAEQSTNKSKLDKMGWMPPLVMGVITGVILFALQQIANGF